MRTDDGSEGCDWTAEDEALADSANETRRHIARIRASYFCTAWTATGQCSQPSVERHLCAEHGKRVA